MRLSTFAELEAKGKFVIVLYLFPPFKDNIAGIKVILRTIQ